MKVLHLQSGALKHDDRIDVLALAVDYWKQHMAVDAATAEADRRRCVVALRSTRQSCKPDE